MEPSIPQLRVRRVVRIALKVRDLVGTSAFYVEALGFRRGPSSTTHAALTLGATEIELVRADGAPYPVPRAANDPWFQHFAIAVSDIGAAYERLLRFNPEPITQGGPQLLPPSTGSVTAYKFRDPEGHPLELSYAPMRASAGPQEDVFLGVDHTALATRDIVAGVAFYTGLGFIEGERLINYGAEQARLDGLPGAVVEIATLRPPEAGPHIELLHYRVPAPAAARPIGAEDVAATQTTLARLPGAPEGAAPDATDPDGHLLHFTS